MSNIYDTMKIMFDVAIDTIDEKIKDEDGDVKSALLVPLWQLITLVEIQRQNLTYNDIISVENVVYCADKAINDLTVNI